MRDPQPIMPSATPETASERLSALSSLLETLDEAPVADASPRAQAEASHENQLVQVRLGIASGLFAALRSKHGPTAAHCLRVAMGCTSWTLAMDMPDSARDEIEVAALLHDIGKIGVPDQILRKPSQLTRDEHALVEHHRRAGLEILRACTVSQEILEIVYYAGAWYDGARDGFDRFGEQLPMGARMLTIVDAFDAMTTDHVYRRAMSRDRAMAELFECAGRQFDPRLVKEYCALHTCDQMKLNSRVVRRWLYDLNPDNANSFWSRASAQAPIGLAPVETMFQKTLLDSMHDAVVFVDTGRRISFWNRSAERMTGIPAASVLEKQWTPELVQMWDERDRDVTDANCPVAHVLRSRTQELRRLSISCRGAERLSVDAHVMSVIGTDGVSHGAALVLHDASSEISLAERVESLHAKATRDPLTQLANRAEFDRALAQFVTHHLEKQTPCSLIICDLDYFKKINDTYGHQAGDEALVGFAALLRRFHRGGDLVARYGGEEFVMLCADCDNATATDRAEEIRRELEQTSQSMLGGRNITASFGVTEVQDGDTPETMLRRADRALLQAKDLGRNTVVQLGSGISGVEVKKQKRGWFWWLSGGTPDQILEQTLVTAVPLKVVVEKLKGFVADHHAEISKISDESVVLKLDGSLSDAFRRQDDRPVPFVIEMGFDEARIEKDGLEGPGNLRTKIRVAIRPSRNRDRRRKHVVDRARKLLSSLKSYLMAHEYGRQPHARESSL